jgi:hypothetical protein
MSVKFATNSNVVQPTSSRPAGGAPTREQMEGQARFMGSNTARDTVARTSQKRSAMRSVTGLVNNKLMLKQSGQVNAARGKR